MRRPFDGREIVARDTDGSFLADIPIPGVPSALVAVEDGVWVAIRAD